MDRDRRSKAGELDRHIVAVVRDAGNLDFTEISVADISET